jgi:hypothetical protein
VLNSTAYYGVSKNTNNRNKTTQDKTNKQKQRKIYQLRLFNLKHDLLKISVYLQTAFAADTHFAEGQWLKKQLNVLKFLMFRVVT